VPLFSFLFFIHNNNTAAANYGTNRKPNPRAISPLTGKSHKNIGLTAIYPLSIIFSSSIPLPVRGGGWVFSSPAPHKLMMQRETPRPSWFSSDRQSGEDVYVGGMMVSEILLYIYSVPRNFNYVLPGDRRLYVTTLFVPLRSLITKTSDAAVEIASSLHTSFYECHAHLEFET